MTTIHRDITNLELTAMRDWLIDYAFGRVPQHDRKPMLEAIFPNIGNIVSIAKANTESYEDILITTYRDIFSDEVMLAEEYCELKDMNDEIRIEYASREIESLYQSRESIFSIKIRNDKGEVAYLGGSFENIGQGSSVNWIYDVFKTKEEFKKYFESDDLSDLSDEEILKRFKKNRK